MFKKNSIFVKVLIPVIVVVMLQIITISSVLFINGTITSLDDGALDSLQKNAENRSISLEDMMVFYWSNLDRLEADAASEIDAYLRDNGLSIDDALGSYEHETNILYNISEPLITALRQTSSTGVYMYFAFDGEEAAVCNGLYYRDLDPVATPADNSDILFLKGHIDIARKDRLQLDSQWSEVFSFSPEYPDAWASYWEPRRAAREYPEASTVNLSYWSRPHLINPGSQLDANPCITYTRPLMYDGRLIAMIGTEVQISVLDKYYPSSDFDSSGKSGYMLVEYDAGSAPGAALDCAIYSATGSYVRRLLSAANASVTLRPAHRDGVYAIAADDIEGVSVVLNPLRLYNSNAPFSGMQWALAAIGTDSQLFESSRNVATGILLSSVFALVLGTVLLAFLIRLSTRPFISIANQIEKSDPSDPIVVSDSNTYEVALLCSTINAMRTKRSLVEAQLREERERYLIALESATDTFMEYDIAQDSFMLYYFSGEAQEPQLRSKVISGLMEQLPTGAVCHPDDAQSVALFMSGRLDEPVEVRARASLFSHITGAAPDGDYYWFLFRASRIYGEDNSVAKIIGTAREITAEKLAEFARIETARRDPTTGFYNRDYGLQLLKNRVYAAASGGAPFALLLAHINDFDKFEAYYGRVYAGVLITRLSGALLGSLPVDDVAVRLTNDECLLFLSGANRASARAKAERILEGAAQIYSGENADLRMSVTLGAALSTDARSGDELLRCAYKAMRHALKTGGAAFYDELPDGQAEQAAYRDKPVSVFLDISRENIVGFVFEFFERTPDVHSAINLLLSVLGDMYGLRRAVVCSYDADFGADRVSHQWAAKGVAPRHTGIEKISHSDMAEFDMLLDENGVLPYYDHTAAAYGEGVRRLLCVTPAESVDALCCVMYEGDAHSGRILFMSEGSGRTWSDAELLSLYEITKIIAAHMSIEKSNYASRAKSEFLSRVSHEIRTPMNAIIGMTDIAKSAVHDIDRLNDCLGKIDFSAKHLLSLINDVLEMSRIESGKLVIENAPFSLGGLVAGIDTLMRPPIEGKGITLTINVACARDCVIGDDYRLRQVLVNLLGNANKFTDRGGAVTFSVEELDAYIPQTPPDADMPDSSENDAPGGGFSYFRFSVRDTGVGISMEDQPHIFRAFEQAASGSSMQKRQGTGLGLAISGNIIAAMGSKIELNSKPGEGSEFFFILRLGMGEELAPAAGVQTDDVDYSGHFAGKRALLVEDNDINIEIASYILGEAGLDIDVAVNGQEAVDRFLASAQGYYDVIFMDIQMPVMDGLTATRHIRKNAVHPDARSIPIIAMTANAFDEDMKKSIESGMNGHIAKPIDIEKLYALLNELLAR